MLSALKNLIFPRTLLADGVQTAVADARGVKPKEHPLGALVQDSPLMPTDPLSHTQRQAGGAAVEGQLLSVNDFPRHTQVTRGADGLRYTGDSKLYTQDSMVTGQGTGGVIKGHSAYGVPQALGSWYASQSFIGYQQMSLMSQHWLVDKACSMPGTDATRNGYALSINSDAMDQPLNPDKAAEYVAKIQDADEDHDITGQMIQYWRNTQIFGIRVCVFEVESDDPEYYEKPFNIDGVTQGSYKGIRQVDPYWMMPVLTGDESSNPVSEYFYDPSYWVIGGRKYHRSHLVIGRGPEVPDILKPTYIYGGVSLTQRIYERVYAAERTANEGPLLAVTKRTTVLKTNLATAMGNWAAFTAKLLKWTELRDNFGVKTIGEQETLEQHDTSLADLDKTIMNQYQLVASIAEVPAVKLLGTSPTGFGSEGTQETKSYHERLESVQKFLSPFLKRHHEMLCRSMFGIDLPIRHAWNRVDTFTAMELATLNKLKADTNAIYTNDIAAISPDEVRTGLKNDPLSGYGHLGDQPAEEEIGATPENDQGMVEAEAKETAASANVERAENDAPDAQQVAESVGGRDALAELATIIKGLQGEYDPKDMLLQVEEILTQMTAPVETTTDTHLLPQIVPIVEEIVTILRSAEAGSSRIRGVKPGVRSSVTDNAQGHRRVADGNQVGLPDNGGVDYTHRARLTRKAGRRTVVIENPAGTVRGGVDKSGNQWRTQMPHDYGYFANTKGADGEGVDVFVGPRSDEGLVFVINQIDPDTGEFDEHKVMIGFNSIEEAERAYRAAFTPEWGGLGSIHQCRNMSEWLAEDDLSQPYREPTV
jgi:hypothetical protein